MNAAQGATPVVRTATAEDWPRIWPFFAEIVRAGETLGYDRDLPESRARSTWMETPNARTTVAAGAGDEILGSAATYRNRGGPGAHVASATFLVAPGAQGRGIGRALVLDALAWARGAGFRAMQFNAVAESNRGAVALYESLGFEVIGTVPEAFEHPREGLVGLHVMHRRL